MNPNDAWAAPIHPSPGGECIFYITAYLRGDVAWSVAWSKYGYDERYRRARITPGTIIQFGHVENGVVTCPPEPRVVPLPDDAAEAMHDLFVSPSGDIYIVHSGNWDATPFQVARALGLNQDDL